MKVSVTHHPIRGHFSTAHGRMTTATLVHVTDGTGWGMAAPMTSVTGSTLEAVVAALEGRGPPVPEAAAATDVMTLDSDARRLGVGVHEVVGLRTRPLRSMVTVPVDEPAAMVERARQLVAAGVRTLKLKMAGGQDLERLAAIHAAVPDTRLVLDANEAWTPDEATRLLAKLADEGYNVVLVEQPVHRDDLEGLAAVARDSPWTVVADEAFQRPTDAARLAAGDACDAVNIKIQKVGGLRAALECARAAKDHGLGILVGCSIESGLGIAAGAVLTPLASWIDLDGNTFLQEDPFPGPDAVHAPIEARAPGFGVEPRSGFPT